MWRPVRWMDSENLFCLTIGHTGGAAWSLVTRGCCIDPRFTPPENNIPQRWLSGFRCSWKIEMEGGGGLEPPQILREGLGQGAVWATTHFFCMPHPASDELAGFFRITICLTNRALTAFIQLLTSRNITLYHFLATVQPTGNGMEPPVRFVHISHRAKHNNCSTVLFYVVSKRPALAAPVSRCGFTTPTAAFGATPGGGGSGKGAPSPVPRPCAFNFPKAQRQPIA